MSILGIPESSSSFAWKWWDPTVPWLDSEQTICNQFPQPVLVLGDGVRLVLYTVGLALKCLSGLLQGWWCVFVVGFLRAHGLGDVWGDSVACEGRRC